MNWLLLRGLSREQRHWREFPGILETRLPGARAHCLDLPGTGTENGRSSPYSIEGIVEDVRGRWLKCRADGDPEWNLLAISLGGMIGMAWCHRYPEDFRNFVLVNSSVQGLSPLFQRMRPGVILPILRAGLERDPLKREMGILKFTTRLRTDVDSLSLAWAELAKERPTQLGTGVRQLIAASRFRVPDSLPTRLLVVSSRFDQLCDPRCSDALARHFHAPHVVHPQAGHDLPLEDPTWLANQVAGFVRGTPSPIRNGHARSLDGICREAP